MSLSAKACLLIVATALGCTYDASQLAAPKVSGGGGTLGHATTTASSDSSGATRGTADLSPGGSTGSGGISGSATLGAQSSAGIFAGKISAGGNAGAGGQTASTGQPSTETAAGASGRTTTFASSGASATTGGAGHSGATDFSQSGNSGTGRGGSGGIATTGGTSGPKSNAGSTAAGGIGGIAIGGTNGTNRTSGIGVSVDAGIDAPISETSDTSPDMLDLASLVAGVSAIVSPGTPGPIASSNPSSLLTTVVAGNKASPSTPPNAMIVGARVFGSGRVIAFGHDALFNNAAELDTGRFIRNSIAWLRRDRSGSILYSLGHSECAPTPTTYVDLALAPEGILLTDATSPLTSAQLAAAAVLIVGNAQSDFTTAEIAAIRSFVSTGGGLLLAGLGWSWEPYHPGRTLADYPMNVLGNEFGVRWLPGYISNGLDQLAGSPIFRDLYPAAPAFPAQP